MNALTMLNGFLPDTRRIEREATSLTELNSKTARRGLVLTHAQALECVKVKNRALAENSRLELGTKTLERLMLTFSRSHYAELGSWPELLESLTELFYFVKTETADTISDAELAELLLERFDGVCGGSVELLTDECERIIREYKGFEPETEEI